VRPVPAGQARRDKEPETAVTYRILMTILLGMLILIPQAGCRRMPPLPEQERHIRDNDLLLHQLSPRAFVGAWGMPTYQRAEFMQFFDMKDGSLVPRSRLAAGDAPRGWEVGIEAGDALFLAYPDHGWLIVFFEEKLVYKEALTAAQLHTLGRSWQHEDKFRSRLEVSPAP
jgi:hypothetical protein